MDINKVASDARIALDAQEQAAFQQEIDEMFAFFERVAGKNVSLEQEQTGGVPMESLRAGDVAQTITREELLSVSESDDEDELSIPRIVE